MAIAPALAQVHIDLHAIGVRSHRTKPEGWPQMTSTEWQRPTAMFRNTSPHPLLCIDRSPSVATLRCKLTSPMPKEDTDNGVWRGIRVQETLYKALRFRLIDIHPQTSNSLGLQLQTSHSTPEIQPIGSNLKHALHSEPPRRHSCA